MDRSLQSHLASVPMSVSRSPAPSSIDLSGTCLPRVAEAVASRHGRSLLTTRSFSLGPVSTEAFEEAEVAKCVRP